jgi:DNA polymerase I-like protein with 3'-5' exonuclease and polymerase domains
MDLYFSRYPGVRQYMERTRQQAREQGYVETVFGRRLYLPEIRAQPFRSAPAPSAPRSTRRCRAPPPTSSSAR